MRKTSFSFIFTRFIKHAAIAVPIEHVFVKDVSSHICWRSRRNDLNKFYI